MNQYAKANQKEAFVSSFNLLWGRTKKEYFLKHKLWEILYIKKKKKDYNSLRNIAYIYLLSDFNR